MSHGVKTTRELIDDFWGQKRLALVGISRDPKDFTRLLLDELIQRGYEVVPVNPNVQELAGQPCFARVQDITPQVDGVLVMTPSNKTDQVVHDCAEAGITRVWMHRGAGTGSVSQTAVDFCHENGIGVVPGFCPFMFMPNTGFIHGVHGFFKKLSGTYPS